ncbi:hypothetical protein ACJX0J_028499, partial [Zea mays]
NLAQIFDMQKNRIFVEMFLESELFFLLKINNLHNLNVFWNVDIAFITSQGQLDNEWYHNEELLLRRTIGGV